MQVVIDSGIDLPLRYSGRVKVVPLKILRGEEEIEQGRICEYLSRGEILKTSQPSIGDFLKVYRSVPEDEEIVSFHISSKLSGTFQTAKIASRMCRRKVTVIDTLNVSAGSGIIVSKFLETNNLDYALRLIPKIKVYAFPVNLEYLKASGRIGGVTAIFGELLGIVPVVEVIDGKALVRKRIRKKEIENFLRKELSSAKEVLFAHACSEEWALELMENLGVDAELLRISLVISCHLGPCVGVAFY